MLPVWRSRQIARGSHAGLAGLTRAQRDQALARWQMLHAHLQDGCPLVHVAGEHGVPERTLRRWLAAYRAGGLAALARRPRSDRGTRRMPPELQLLIEGLALRRPPPTIATVHRQAAEVARAQGWPAPGYAAVYDVVRNIDPALATLGARGLQAVQRRCSTWCTAARPPSRTRSGRPTTPCWTCGCSPRGRQARPWLTIIEDDHSRAVAGYAVNLGAPSALTTALAFRQAIWRKPWPGWHVCGIPDAFHVDHGSDFTSAHLAQVMADLRTRASFSFTSQTSWQREDRTLLRHRQSAVPADQPGYSSARRGLSCFADLVQRARADTRLIAFFLSRRLQPQPHSETGLPPHHALGGELPPRLPERECSTCCCSRSPSLFRSTRTDSLPGLPLPGCPFCGRVCRRRRHHSL